MSRSLTSLDGWFNKIITNEKRRQLRSGVASQVAQSESIRKGIHRAPSASETNRASVQALHYYVFCSHEIPYWRCCAKCGRDARSAERNAEMILGKATAMKSSL